MEFPIENKLANVELVSQPPSDPELLSPFVDAYLTSSPNLSRSAAAERLQDPLRFANLKVLLKQASGVVAGCQRTTEDVVKAALEFLRVPKSRVSSFFLMVRDERWVP
jgi:phosphotransacetylase